MQRLSVLTLAAILGFAASASAQVMNPSFENSGFGVPINWTAAGGAGTASLSFLPDAGMATAGSRYVAIDGGGTGPATAHSNEGGLGTDASGTYKLSQSFSFNDTTLTTLSFDCVLLGNDDVGDFFEASISDGTKNLNLVHLDVLNDVGTGLSSFTGLPTSVVTTVSVDLGTTFAGSDLNTVFTLTFHVGNAVDTAQASRAYVDNIQLLPGTPFKENSIRFIPAGSWVQLEIKTEAPFLEYYDVISHNTSFPKGSGPFGGIWPDAQTWSFVSLPIGNAGIHDYSNSVGEFNANIFGALAPQGFPFDYFLAVFLPNGDLRLTPVKRGLWNLNEDI